MFIWSIGHTVNIYILCLQFILWGRESTDYNLEPNELWFIFPTARTFSSYFGADKTFWTTNMVIPMLMRMRFTSVPTAQNFLDFMQFLEIFDKIMCWRPPTLEGRRPLLQGILDHALIRKEV